MAKYNETNMKVLSPNLLTKACFIFLIFMTTDYLLKALNLVGASNSWAALISKFILSMGLSALAYRLMKDGKLFTQPPKWSIGVNILIILIGLYFSIYAVRGLAIYQTNAEVITKALLAATAAAFFEEALYRGLFFDGLLSKLGHYKHSLLWSGIGSALIFGFSHFYNLAYLDFGPVSQQVFYATIFGFLLAAVRIRFNGLAAPIILHFLVDFQPTITSTDPLTQAPWGILLARFIPIACVGLVTLYFMDRDLSSR